MFLTHVDIGYYRPQFGTHFSMRINWVKEINSYLIAIPIKIKSFYFYLPNVVALEQFCCV